MKNATKKATVMDPIVLEAALQGLELQQRKLGEQINYVRALLGKRGPGRPKADAPKPIETVAADPKPSRQTKKKRVLSAAARKSIAMAQKRRWAEYHKKAESGEPTEPRKKNKKKGRKKSVAAVKKAATKQSVTQSVMPTMPPPPPTEAIGVQQPVQ
jgi:hypothetical protein